MKDLALLFLKLGTIGFGGPAAHISMMEEECVKRRSWLTHEHFLDLLGLTNLIPGPNSTEMAIHIGYLRAGWKGLVVAGLCFIFPAVAITLVFAYLYVQYGTLPQFGSFMVGIRPAVIAIISAAVFRLGKPASKKPIMIVIGLTVMILSLLRVDELLLLVCGGIIGIVWNNRSRLESMVSTLLPLNVLWMIQFPSSAMSGSAALTGGATIVTLGLFFLKIGSILYGSGYVLVAFLQGGLIDARHWLTQTQLLDAIAVGQFTPGPVLSTATFIGYVILGVPGAIVATTGIFFPSFVFVMMTAPFLPRLRASTFAKGFLDGINAASLGLMLSVSVTLAASSLTNPLMWIILFGAIIVMIFWNISSMWIMSGAAMISWVGSWLHL